MYMNNKCKTVLILNFHTRHRSSWEDNESFALNDVDDFTPATVSSCAHPFITTVYSIVMYFTTTG